MTATQKTQERTSAFWADFDNLVEGASDTMHEVSREQFKISAEKLRGLPRGVIEDVMEKVALNPFLDVEVATEISAWVERSRNSVHRTGNLLSIRSNLLMPLDMEDASESSITVRFGVSSQAVITFDAPENSGMTMRRNSENSLGQVTSVKIVVDHESYTPHEPYEVVFSIETAGVEGAQESSASIRLDFDGTETVEAIKIKLMEALRPEQAEFGFNVAISSTKGADNVTNVLEMLLMGS